MVTTRGVPVVDPGANMPPTPSPSSPRLRVSAVNSSMPLSLNERQLIDLPQESFTPAAHLLHRRFAQKRHPFLRAARRISLLGFRFRNHLPDAVRSGPKSSWIADRPRNPVPPHSKHPAPSRNAKSRHSSGLIPLSTRKAVRVAYRPHAFIADHAHQPLRQDAQFSDETKLYGSPPYQEAARTSRTLFACTVVNTKWPSARN